MPCVIRFVSLTLAVMLLLSGCPDAFRERPDEADEQTPVDDPGDNGNDPGGNGDDPGGNGDDALSYDVAWSTEDEQVAIGQSGGITYNATMQAHGTGRLYWGVSNEVPLGIALDGAIDTEGEELEFDDDESELDLGRLVFAGSAVVELHGDDTTRTFDTRMTITVTDAAAEPLALVRAADVGFAGIGGMLLIYDSGSLLESFTLNIIAAGKDGDDWVPVAELYDSLQTPADSEKQVQVEYWGIFYEVED